MRAADGMVNRIVEVILENCQKEESKMEYIDEIIGMLEALMQCPEDWEHCSGRLVGNDCDNQCVFLEAADMLRDYKRLKVKEQDTIPGSGPEAKECGHHTGGCCAKARKRPEISEKEWNEV